EVDPEGPEHRLVRVRQDVDEVGDGRARVAAHVAHARLEHGLGDREDTLAAQDLPRAVAELLDVLRERSLTHGRLQFTTSVDVVIRRALPAEARALTRIAHAAKRPWKYPAAWIRLWRDALTVTPQFVERHRVYCAVAGASVLGFYALSGAGATRELE